MLEQYFPVLLFILFGMTVGAVLLTVGSLLAPSRPDAEKLSPYECGFEAFEDARMKFDVRYYLVAILFILFDLEIAFLFPVGGRASRNRLVRLRRDDAVSGRAGRRVRLRVEEGCARVGVAT